MQIVNPNWERTLRMKIWTETMENTFISIDYPRKEKGSGTLRKSSEMWNFLPKVGKVIKVPPSMMGSSWMGSDFTNDDLVKETTLSDDYTSKFIDGADKDKLYIELVAKKDAVTVYGKILLVVDKKNNMPITEEYFDERGNKVRTLYFSEIKKLGGRELPTKLVLIPEVKEKRQTTIRYSDAQFDTKLPSDTFTLINLQRKR